MIGLYDVYDKDGRLIIGRETSGYIGFKMNRAPSTVATVARTGGLLCNRYKVIRVGAIGKDQEEAPQEATYADLMHKFTPETLAEWKAMNRRYGKK